MVRPLHRGPRMGPLAAALIFTIGFFTVLYVVGRYEERQWEKERARAASKA